MVNANRTKITERVPLKKENQLKKVGAMPFDFLKKYKEEIKIDTELSSDDSYSQDPEWDFIFARYQDDDVSMESIYCPLGERTWQHTYNRF